MADYTPLLQPGQTASAAFVASPPIFNSSATPPATSVPPTQQNSSTSIPPTTPGVPPATNLQPGSQGQDVSNLQSYLVQMGYLTPQQVATGEGTYGPQTTAAVAKMQQDLGIQSGTGSGSFGPQTQAAIAQKYQNAFTSLKGSIAPNRSSDANQQIQTMLQSQSQTSSDPVFGAMATSLAPIMQSLTQVLQNINDPALTAVSLQQEYNTLAQQNNLPGMNASLMNMQNIMNGTTQDIRDEVTSSGGVATESQVQAMSAARNNVILKQYNALATQYQAAQTNVQNMMQYATTDQATQLQRENASASITESMASIETQMISMGVTMQQNAKQAVQYNVTQTGYAGLAASAQGNPQVLSYYEQMLNLAPGTLSNPNSIGALDTYKQQQLAISQENAQNAGNRTVIYAAANGVGMPGSTGVGTVTADGSTSPTTIPTASLLRPSWLNTNVPLSMTSGDMTQYVSAAGKNATVGGTAGTNAYGNNVTVQGVGNYVAQPDGSYILESSLPPAGTSNVSNLISAIQNQGSKVPPLNYTDIKNIEANAPPSQYSPASQPFYREERAARQLVGNYISSPVYQTVSQAPLPFARIQAARNGDNSVSDTELLDAYISLAKGQGQITEAQISAITGASSVSDKLNIIKQKVSGAGALISSDQRKSLLSLSGQVFDEYSAQYQNLYTQAVNTLAGNHVDPNVWGVIPDFTTMITTGDTYANLNE